MALKKSELMLEEDAIRFDTFLKDNDRAHDAIHAAEEETRLKGAKQKEIMELMRDIAAIKSQETSLKEQLELCQEYKSSRLAPPEFFGASGSKRSVLVGAWRPPRQRSLTHGSRRSRPPSRHGS